MNPEPAAGARARRGYFSIHVCCSLGFLGVASGNFINYETGKVRL